MKLKHLITAFTLAVAAALAHADIILSGWTFGSGNVVATTLWSGQAGGYTGALALDGFNLSSFNTYCVELTESFSFSSSPMPGYQIVNGATYFGSSKAEELGKLMSYVALHPAEVDTAAESTSLQLAIWNLVYDSDRSLLGGSFTDSSVYGKHATELLEESADARSNVAVYALSKNGSQDFILTLAVPEPTSLSLALVGLFALRRKHG